MVSTFLASIANAPLNTTMMVFCSVLWFVMWNKRMTFENVSVSYNAVVKNRQYYRIVSAAFTHANLMHIVFNMGSLYAVGVLEGALGTYFYLRTTVLLLFVSMFLWLLITYICVKKFNRASYAETPAVGYSGVIFGWMTVMQVLQPSGSMPIFGGFSIPYILAPFGSLLITQLIVPRASFLGHLSGIFAGYLIGFGFFNWVEGYWLWTSVLYAVFVMVVSIRANPNLNLVSRFVQLSPEFVRVTGLGGSQADIEGAAAPTTQRYMDNGILRVFQRTTDNNIQQPAQPTASLWDRTRQFWNFGRIGGSSRQYNTVAEGDTEMDLERGDTGGTRTMTPPQSAAAPSERPALASPPRQSSSSSSSPPMQSARQ
jgi:membrane associated rhomboid family serine protease